VLTIGCGRGKVVCKSEQLVDLNQVGLQGLAGEFPVAPATGDALGQDQVVNLEAEGDSAAVTPGPRGDLHPDEAVLPPRWRLCRLGTDAVGEVSVYALKRRAVAKAPSIAWLPITTISRSSETSAAAEITCSNWARFIEPSYCLEDLPALRLTE